MFTQEQIEFINQLIDARVARHTQQGQSHHSLSQVRSLILVNLYEFKTFCLGGEFHVATLTSFLKQKTELTLRDNELMSRGKEVSPLTRFESQVHTCLMKWRNPPIERATRRGYYRFVNSSQPQP
jgi:hypothetical protein